MLYFSLLQSSPLILYLKTKPQACLTPQSQGPHPWVSAEDPASPSTSLRANLSFLSVSLHYLGVHFLLQASTQQHVHSPIAQIALALPTRTPSSQFQEVVLVKKFESPAEVEFLTVINSHEGDTEKLTQQLATVIFPKLFLSVYYSTEETV